MGFKSSNGGSKDSPRKEFVPSTSDDLKRYRKNGRKADEAKAAKKATRNGNGKKANRREGLEMRKVLLTQQEVSITDQFFDELVETIKERGGDPPAYRGYLKTEEADAYFMFDMQIALSKLTWNDLHRLCCRATNRNVVLRDYSECFHALVYLIAVAFGVRNYLKGKGVVKITNRDALEDWPLPARKRRSSNDEDNMTIEERNTKLKAMARDDEDEDDDDDDDEEEVAEDEDDDDEDDEEDEEDEKPARRKAKKKAKDDEDDEDEDDDEDDEEDDEDVDDEDEDDEDEKPRSKKSKGKQSTKSKRSSKDDDEDEEETEVKTKKKAKGGAKEKMELTDRTVVKMLKPRKKGGPKKKLFDLIPKKGITVKELTKKAVEAEVPAKKVKPWLLFFSKYELVSFG